MQGESLSGKRAAWSAVGAAALCALAAAAVMESRAVRPPDVAPLEREVSRLRAELELAGSDRFYLRLDPARGVLELLLRGVVLGRYPARTVELGTARRAFRPLPAPPDWDRVVHAGGRLEPARDRDRLEVFAGSGAESEPTPPPVPPTAEESVSVPDRWRVLFDDGLSLEIRAPGGGRHRTPWRRALDRFALWRVDWSRIADGGARGRVWLRAELSADDAAALYRSLPPEVSLVLGDAGPR